MRVSVLILLVVLVVVCVGGCGVPARSASESRWWTGDYVAYSKDDYPPPQTPRDQAIQALMDGWIGAHQRELRDKWGEPDEEDWFDRAGVHGEVYYMVYFRSRVSPTGDIVQEEDVSFLIDRDGYVVWYAVDFY